MKSDDIIIWIMIFLVIIIVCVLTFTLGWAVQHNSSDYLKPCILAGYDTAEWQAFTPEPVCVKRTPLSKIDGAVK